MSTNKAIAKSAGIIGFATTSSRVLGLVRDQIIAGFFGTAMFAQAFIVAFRIPNLLRDLVGEGATNAAFVPVFSDYLVKKPREEFWKLVQIVLTFLTLALVTITILGIIAAPAIVTLIAPGFINDAAKFAITVKLTRIIMPYILFIGLAACFMGVSNTIGIFAAPAFGPALLNISVISAAFLICPWLKESVLGLGIGVLIGGLIQLTVQILVLLKKGFHFRFNFNIRHPAVRHITHLLIPRAFGSAVYQISLLVDTVLASLAFVVGEGGVAALYYSARVCQLPLAVFGVAIAQAALPRLSQYASSDDMDQFRHTLLFSLKSVFFILIPSSVGLIVLSQPIIKVIFERGQFTAYSTGITSSALLFASIGLVAYGGIKVLVNAFYSLQDTLTPVKVAATAVTLNIALNLILMWPLKIGGLTLATAIAATYNFIVLFIILRRKIKLYNLRGLVNSFLRTLLAALVMGLVAYSLKGFTEAILPFVMVIIVSIATFFIIAKALRIEELEKILKWALKRK